ncbi:MAG: hypothetical protein QOK28_639 [Actinomycetota bacterium]
MRKFVGVFVLVVALVFAAGTPRVDAAAEYTLNWSGFAVPAGEGQQMTAVTGSWIVPMIRTAPPGFSSSWIGIGGYGTRDLIQTGTASSGRLEGDYAWYETLPDNETRITGCAGDATCAVKQGDRVSASVTNVGGSTWVIAMTDSGRWWWSKTLSYQSSLSSAEWVFEAPTVGFSGVPVGFQTLPAYAPHARFLSGGTYRVNGVNRPLTTGVATRLKMFTATPSFVAPDGHFTVCAYKPSCKNF